MKGFGPTTYGDGFADVYDQWYEGITDAAGTTAFLLERLPAGPLLELGVGSGRLARPLIDAGIPTIGVDASAAMLERCGQNHPDVPLVRGDLARLPIGPGVAGALCAFNTLFNLPTAAQQQDLLQRMASILQPQGLLVIEAMTGDGLADQPGSSVGVSKMSTDQLVLSATRVDATAQTIQGQHVDITEAGGVKLRPWLLRWTTPTQLDALAEEVGLKLSERYAGWRGEAFDADSETHVSVYRRP